MAFEQILASVKSSNAFSLQQLAIIRKKNRTFAYRKRGELLDGRLSFPMTLKRGRWSGKMADFSTA